MLSPIELRVERRNTTAYIARAPITVTLVKSSKVRQAGGGWKYVDGDPKAPQTVTLILQTAGALSNDVAPLAAGDGRNLTLNYIMVGEWNADIEEGDKFTLNGREARVQYLLPYNGYEVRAAVVTGGE